MLLTDVPKEEAASSSAPPAVMPTRGRSGFEKEPEGRWQLVLPGVVSRKKQFILGSDERLSGAVSRLCLIF